MASNGCAARKSAAPDGPGDVPAAAGSSRPAQQSKWDEAPEGTAEREADEIDPLDAYMMGVQQEFHEDQALIGTGVKRKQPEVTTGVETSKNAQDFDSRMREWQSTRGNQAFQARRAYNKKMKAMAPPTD
mmetsp:Transcript_110826/g.220429  ORF Transcript_110826/g.220429 Transcript_110826/m.220429 type:complete len:130 (+) Transcript_110826:68-457(+)|eukprot:CAMPEP_0172722984 /NCGR_PEP_ID=MMETSP1074-20121228/82726_1 /TAXON_ID=2916 /ORGANISM="Ceratium fusus, Strain PA161109" /LENGTH=129 /DNA_ID=CAMNT_0013549121 /DNA_START=62 /DNA_END=451 /DNA_ORIENTATION=-